jgi:uncharacterized protein YbjT (DUF2867 family)
MYAVMGATGHTGSRIARTLLEAGEPVRAIGRSRSKLAELEAAGAELAAGDASDAAFLADAFRGATGVYALIPPSPQAPNHRAAQDAVGQAIIEALRDSSVRHVVFLSSLGAHVPEGTGPVAGLHAQELRLRGLHGVDVLILRAAYFFENFYMTLGLIKHQGINGGAVAADLMMPMIATRDIADAAARALRERNWSGLVVRELLGQRDLTHAEATRILGARIGKPDLPYVQLPYDDYRGALMQMGVSPDGADTYTELARALNEGLVAPVERRSPENTTPTAIEAFAEEFARAYEAA